MKQGGKLKKNVGYVKYMISMATHSGFEDGSMLTKLLISYLFLILDN